MTTCPTPCEVLLFVSSLKSCHTWAETLSMSLCWRCESEGIGSIFLKMACLAELSAAPARFLICPTATGTEGELVGPDSTQLPAIFRVMPAGPQGCPGCLASSLPESEVARNPNLKLKGKESVNTIPPITCLHWQIISLTPLALQMCIP